MVTAQALLFVLALAPGVLLPRPLDLSAAMSDPVELERLVTRLGPGRTLQLVRSAARSGQQRAATAALRGLALAGVRQPELAAVALVPLIELLAQTPDEKLQTTAADTLIRLAGAVGRAPCDEPDDQSCGGELPMAPYYLVQLAARPALSVGLRAQLLQALSFLPVAQWQAEAQRLVALLRDARSTAEQAALRPVLLGTLAVLAQYGDSRWLMQVVQDAPDPQLAAAAAAELCQPAAPRRRPGPPANSSAPPSLPPPLLARVRALALPEQPPAVRQKVEVCLRLWATPQDKALLQAPQPAASSNGNGNGKRKK
jgi:hypothetical protein